MKFLRELRSVLNLTVLVAGLGYFVDLFDITLFGVVRAASLRDIGITSPEEVLSKGILIYNCQMVGMMVGGLLWGVLADKRGRLSVMFGSILLYSFANLANAFAWDVTSYAVFRFLGGVGLAGELGAAITLVAESLPKEKRGLGTTIVATLGMLGIVAAAFVGQHLNWKVAYFTGGIMGIALLFARFKVSESELFTKKTDPSRANPLLLLQGNRFLKYICCILIGVPIYFTTGILFTFAPELTAGLNVQGTVTAGNAILYGSIGLTIGDLLAGLFSQWLKSRKRAVALNLVGGFLLMLVYGLVPGLTSTMVYILSFLIGIMVGYWAVLVTMAAEQFGTNIRGTVATTVPNFVRGSAAIAASGFAVLKGHISVPAAALTVGSICFGLALLALTRIEETFHRDLDYEETGPDAATAPSAGPQAS
ncbi:MFS transporter [Myxococcus sp. MISCRS1]|uniref:MFS transporter n=1 Tax=Myxococcus TaxID=32 RepID=UPI001CBF2404|nr:MULTISPECIES: MFS transporter [unclassified Myxococcus]MBZ4397335.1 MFS transporter [Myxococcus sp. AS-1-15]MBZ4410693.1 MFS transporter [Myxococcus sp. XM-1-1-1]MCY1003843.1 MFS transporter [Myxococcus sp. MISCRS1]BDT34572.1 MFS transporter [Myxococcus sp. MH1]